MFGSLLLNTPISGALETSVYNNYLSEIHQIGRLLYYVRDFFEVVSYNLDTHVESVVYAGNNTKPIRMLGYDDALYIVGVDGSGVGDENQFIARLLTNTWTVTRANSNPNQYNTTKHPVVIQGSSVYWRSMYTITKHDILTGNTQATFTIFPPNAGSGDEGGFSVDSSNVWFNSGFFGITGIAGTEYKLHRLDLNLANRSQFTPTHANDDSLSSMITTPDNVWYIVRDSTPDKLVRFNKSGEIFTLFDITGLLPNSPNIASDGAQTKPVGHFYYSSTLNKLFISADSANELRVINESATGTGDLFSQTITGLTGVQGITQFEDSNDFYVCLRQANNIINQTILNPKKVTV